MSGKINLEKVIEQCDLIETKQSNCNNWIKTKIISIYGDFIEVAKVKDYISSVLMIGDTLDCRIVHNDTIIIINAEVYNIKLATCSIVLKIHSSNKIQNSRKNNRYNISLSASFCKLNDICDNYCVVVNLSMSGISILTKSQLCVGDNIELNINYKNALFFTVKCEVKWDSRSNLNNYYGLAITGTDEKSKSLYYDFIKKLQRYEQIKSEKINKGM